MSDETQTLPEQGAAAPASKPGLLRRWAPVLVMAAAIAAFFGLGLDQYLSLEALRAHRHDLIGFVADHGILAVLIFLAVYATATALSLPGGAALTVTGGFLFGSLFGTLWVVAGATVGATAVFLVAKTALGDSLRAKAGPFLARMEAGFQENALSYLLVLRLIPLFPFFIVNLVPAFLGVGLRTYVIGTFLGIIPGTFVFASVGAGLGSLLDQPGEISLAGVLSPEVITALVGLSLLSLLPVAYKKLNARRRKTQAA